MADSSGLRRDAWEVSNDDCLGLCLPPLVFCLLDAAITLFGQSAQYWAGDYAQVNEGSPTFYDLLQIRPAASVVGTLVWILVFVGRHCSAA